MRIFSSASASIFLANAITAAASSALRGRGDLLFSSSNCDRAWNPTCRVGGRSNFAKSVKKNSGEVSVSRNDFCKMGDD